jgi:hypothetical protein
MRATCPTHLLFVFKNCKLKCDFSAMEVVCYEGNKQTNKSMALLFKNSKWKGLKHEHSECGLGQEMLFSVSLYVLIIQWRISELLLKSDSWEACRVLLLDAMSTKRAVSGFGPVCQTTWACGSSHIALLTTMSHTVHFCNLHSQAQPSLRFF